MQPNSPDAPRRRLLLPTLAVVYALLGALGLALAIPPGYASPVFPAAGFALAIVLRFGRPALASVWLGSALLNVGVALSHGTLSGSTALLAIGIATGALLQAWAGHWLVQRWAAATWQRLEHERDVLRFLAVGGPLACLVSATCGVLSLTAAGIVPPVAFGYAWWNWYVGDTLGVLTVAPLALAVLLRHEARWRARLRTMVPPVIVVLGLAAAMFVGVARWETEDLQRNLEEHGRNLAHSLQNRLVAHEEALSSVARFIELTPNPDAEAFEHFTSATLSDHPEISALSFNPYVKLGERAVFEQRMAKISSAGEFAITEHDAGRRLVRAGDRPMYVPVAYITPQDGNQPAIGFDINSEPVRRDAIRRASQCGRAAATASLHLVQDVQGKLGLLLLASACSRGGWAKEVPLSHPLLGFAVAVIKIEDLVEIATRGQRFPGLVVELDDPAADAGQRVLYRSDPDFAFAEGSPEWSTRLTLADREWTLRVLPDAGYLQAHRPWMAWAVGVAGLLFGALLQVLLLAVTGRAALIERRVDEQTLELRDQKEALAESENRFRSVVENVKEVIFQTDASGLWTYLNPAWTEITGHSVADSLGTLFLDYVHPDDRARNTALFAPLIERKKDYCRHEIRYLHRDGGFRWIEVFARLTLGTDDEVLGTSGTLTDITERRKAEATLRASESALNHAQEVAHLGSWELDIDRDRLVCSAESYRLFGVTPGTPLGSGHFFERIHPDDRGAVTAAWKAALAGAPYDIEHRILADGRTLWVHGRAEVTFDSTGKAVHALGTVQDITVQKQLSLDLEIHREHLDALVKARTAELLSAQHALATAEAQYRGLVESPVAGVFIMEGNRFRYVNPALATIHGCASAEEMIALGDPEQWLAPEDVERVAGNARRVLAGGTASSLEFTGLRRDGSNIALEVYVTQASYEGRPAVAGLVLDISQRKAVQAALARDNERFRIAVEAAPMAILMTDGSGRIVLANPMLAKIFGYEPGELLGQPVETLIPTPLRARHSRLHAEFRGAPGMRPMGMGRDLEGQRKDGSRFPVEVGLGHMALGDATLILAAISDITDHQLAIARQEEARAVAEAASVAKSSFLANMSHEIRTPLNAILGMIHLVRRAGVTDKQADYLDKQKTAGEHLLAVINAILELAKIESGKYELAEKPFDVREMVDLVAGLLQERVQAKKLQFTISVATRQTSFRGDATRLQQALLNFANNAVKFTESGTVALRVSADEESADEALLRFEVEDTGIGIAPEALERLFEPFEQADNSATRKYGGTGLGLVITKKIAELMGGAAGAASTPGAGSTFWFTARLKKTQSASAPEAESGSAEMLLRRDHRGRRVLLVEDEPINREIAQAHLEDAGLNVTTASSGAQAVRLATDRPFDLILMDLKMPEMDGLEATRRIREVAHCAGVPIVALTANAFAEDRKNCIAAGMVDFVTKPFDPELLYSVLLRRLPARPSGEVVSPPGNAAGEGGSAAGNGDDWSI